MCDRHDIGLAIRGADGQAQPRRAYTDAAAESEEPTIFIYDNYPGGIGFSEPLFGLNEPLLSHTRQLIEQCPCDTGCPACVGPIGQTGPLVKTVTLAILEGLGVQAATDLAGGS